MSIHEVMRLLPHRFPFLLIDRVLEFEANTRLLALKNISVNEPCFTGHFPDYPIFPGVLILEAMAQATGLLAFKSGDIEPSDDMLYMFAGVDNARFKRPVIPGDQLLIEATMGRARRGIYKFKARATVDGELACEADLISAVQERQA